jgi:hypothetical protein
VAKPSNPTVFWWTAANPTCRLRSWAATLHRLLLTTSSCFSRHHAARTCPRWPPGPLSQAYLSLHSSEAPQGIDLSHPLFTCTNANQVATYTYNTRPRVSPHHVVNHSSQPGVTIHRSSNAPVLNLPLDSALTTHTSNQFREKRKEIERKKNSNKWSKAKQKPRKDHLSEKNLSPLRQGQRLDTTEIKCSKIADSSRWGKRARHHRQKSTTKI